MLRLTGPWGQMLTGTVLAVIAASLGGCLSSEPPLKETTAPKVVDATRVALANGPEQVTLSGQVQASEHTRLSFEVAGEVRSLTVDVGDTVSAGDVLATLDRTRYQLARDQALASEREAASALQEARLDHQRQAKLAERGFGSQARLDSALAALESARHRHEAAVASRQLAERDLAQTRLTAPFRGTVSQRMAEPAERVAAGQAVLTVISDREGYEVDTSVSETLISRLSVHSSQAVSIPVLGIARAPASIHQIGSEPLSANNYPVTLTLSEPLPGLRSGMTAQVHLSMTPSGDTSAGRAFRVPLTGLVYDGEDQAHLLRINQEQRLQRVRVQVINTAGERAIVTGPLDAGDRIVARGAEFVAEGDQVNVLGEGPDRFH